MWKLILTILLTFGSMLFGLIAFMFALLFFPSVGLVSIIYYILGYKKLAYKLINNSRITIDKKWFKDNSDVYTNYIKR